jgi:hypothetical protein
MSRHQVKPLGRVPWHKVVRLLDGATCVWQDLDGLHHGPAPGQPPLATHVWAWNEKSAWRFRVDGDSCIGAALTLGDGTHAESAVIRARKSPDPQLAALLQKLAEEVQVVLVGDQSQVLFLVGKGDT